MDIENMIAVKAALQDGAVRDALDEIKTRLVAALYDSAEEKAMSRLDARLEAIGKEALTDKNFSRRTRDRVVERLWRRVQEDGRIDAWIDRNIDRVFAEAMEGVDHALAERIR